MGARPIAHSLRRGTELPGPVLLQPIQQASSGAAHDANGDALLIECGDEAAVTASDGRARLTFEAPPADTEAVDPWERRGGEEG